MSRINSVSNDSINFWPCLSKQRQTKELSCVEDLNTTATCFLKHQCALLKARNRMQALQKLSTMAHLRARELDARRSTKLLFPKSTTMARRYQDSRPWKRGDPQDSKVIKSRGYRFEGRLKHHKHHTWSKTYLPGASSRLPSKPRWTVALALWCRI